MRCKYCFKKPMRHKINKRSIGAGLGIGRLAAGVAEGIARQPSAEKQIVAATNLSLFLLEGVCVLGVVTCLLVVLLKN